MNPELRAKIITYNCQRAKDKRKADDPLTLLFALPASSTDWPSITTTGSPSRYRGMNIRMGISPVEMNK